MKKMNKPIKNYFIPVDLSFKTDLDLPDEELEIQKLAHRKMIHEKHGIHPLEAFEQKFIDLFIKGLKSSISIFNDDEKKRVRSLRSYRNQLRTKICSNCTFNITKPNQYFCGSIDQCRVARFYRNITEFLKEDKCPYCNDDADYFDLEELTIGRKLIKSLKSWKKNRYKWREKAFAAKRALDAALLIDIEWVDD